ncbi:hypothetical protein NPIL_458921 [Nephila pilipes]|uniref:Uncharacterized protein n=1 Tax=Nephila pilipes TaxID=299642 RepID=A0A8X6NRR9_NEPPI|nr:hypothetical protein NPIL_458921 [Nephila pilipes]
MFIIDEEAEHKRGFNKQEIKECIGNGVDVILSELDEMPNGCKEIIQAWFDSLSTFLKSLLKNYLSKK